MYLKSISQDKSMNKKLKKKMIITQEEHDKWHKKHKGYDEKNNKEHDICHRKIGIIVKMQKTR
jgi:uncharacterized HAD superfamily protein